MIIYLLVCFTAKVVMNSVGSRVAANFDGKSEGPHSVVSGTGRGILARGSSGAFISEPITPGPSQERTPTPTGKGRGRGVMLGMDSDLSD
jgi:hypothetical protein